MVAHKSTAIRYWAIAGVAGFAIAASSLFSLPVSARQGRGAAPAPGARGGGGQGTPVVGPDGEVWGFSNTAFNPDTRWRIHDPERPQPPAVTPGETVSIPAPSDAIVLFNGKDLSQWVNAGPNGAQSPATWVVRDGYFEAQGGNLSTRESFGDVQMHLEYAIPADVTGTSQNRGNGGVTFMGRYEIQILDSYNNRTYADGMMASIYGEWPPLVNVSRKPGEWQSLDIVFEAPRFTGRRNARILYGFLEWRDRAQPRGTVRHYYADHDAARVYAARSGTASATAGTRARPLSQCLDSPA